MAAENPELEEINRLLEVEKEATALITNAMTDADKKLADARAKFNEQVKAKIEEKTAELTKAYNSRVEQLQENHKTEIETFKSDLMKKNQNQKQLNSLLDKLLVL